MWTLHEGFGGSQPKATASSSDEGDTELSGGNATLGQSLEPSDGCITFVMTYKTLLCIMQLAMLVARYLASWGQSLLLKLIIFPGGVIF